MSGPSWLEIDLGGLAWNLAAVRGLVGSGVRVCCVVKSDAYGLGAVPIAERLAASGADMLAVYSADQAETLVSQGVDMPLLLLMPVRGLDRGGALGRFAASGRLHFSIHDVAQIEQVNAIGQSLGCVLPVHLYLDTGMSRSGLELQEASVLLERLGGGGHVQLVGLYTHLATAGGDPVFAQEQLSLFEGFVAANRAHLGRGVLLHAANTFAALRGRRYHLSMVRVGLGLLGYGGDLMTGGVGVVDGLSLKPVVRWVSGISHIQRYPQGARVGYGGTCRLNRDSVLGVVPVGYGDGYPLALSNKGVVRVLGDGDQQGAAAKVLGQVSMDQIVIDLTDCGGIAGGAGPRVGGLVELISNDAGSPCSLVRLADLAGSNCYELLCRVSGRVERRYMGDAQRLEVHVSPAAGGAAVRQ